VFALASIFEPLGVGLLEAMAAGVPIVATRVNELAEILADGETGLLVPPGSPEAMAASLVRLAKNPELRRRLGEQAQQEARSRFGLRRVVEQYQELYDEVRPSAGRALVREQARFG
jgi:glycosyltransferase involved in cell wall biosynthesis